jgi:hypothetical protein
MVAISPGFKPKRADRTVDREVLCWNIRRVVGREDFYIWVLGSSEGLTPAVGGTLA